MCISITKMIDTSIIVIYHAMSLTVHTDVYQYHQDDWYIYHSDLSHLWLYILMCISITKMIDTSIIVIYHTMSLTVHTDVYQYHQDDWYIYHSDLSHYVSDYTYWCVSVSPRWLIHLSQWFITLCLWLYILMCISITKMIDTSIIVIYHAMSLTVHTDVYQYQQDDWYIYHSDLSHYVSDCTYWCVSVSPRWLIHLS